MRYDLRPLLADLRVVTAGPPVVVRVRTRIHPELGTGRPDEVVLALAERLGVAVTDRADRARTPRPRRRPRLTPDGQVVAASASAAEMSVGRKKSQPSACPTIDSVGRPLWRRSSRVPRPRG